MGIPAQPLMHAVHVMPHARAGAALPVTLLAITLVTVLGASTWLMVGSNKGSSMSREDTARALMLAEAGAAHAFRVLTTTLASQSYSRLLQGSDGAGGTTDDGLLIGYGMATGDEIPAAGVARADGRYYVRILDDDLDGDADPLRDLNYRVIVRCRGITTRSGSATVDLVLGNDPPVPALLVDGQLSISGNPTLTGPCGGVHANGDVFNISGNIVVSGDVSATGSVTVSGSVTDTLGNPVTPIEGAPAVSVPAYDPNDYCNATHADYIADSSTGRILRVSDNTLHNANGTTQLGWKYNGSNKWTHEPTFVPGSFCIKGNAYISANPGTAGSPLAMSIFATGSIEVSGNPYLMPDHPNGLLLIAGGDLKISGNPSATAINYGGLMYARAQCEVSGTPSIDGNLICDDDAALAGSDNLVAENKISGDATFRFDCGSANMTRRILGWYPVITG